MSRSKKAKRDKTPEAAPPAEAPRRRGRNWLRTAGLLLGLAVVAGLVTGVKHLSAMWAAHWIDRDIDSFLAEPAVPLPAKTRGSPRLSGKLLPVDRERRRVSDLYYELPDALRPDSAQEVGTVAWLESTAGSKELNGKPFHWRETKVTLIDRDHGKVLDECKFRTGGAEAIPDSVARKGVLEYLTHLPGAAAGKAP